MNMKISKKKFFKLLNNLYPYFIFFLLIGIFFWKVIVYKQIPLPADLVAGAYFPWLDYKWGYDVGVPVKNLITSDVVSVIYPLRSYAIDLIKSGQNVLWNSLMFGGYPLLANFQVGILSPTIFLYFLFSKIDAWTLQIMIQPFLCMVFSYLFLRQIKLSKPASVMGSIVYAFSGFNLIWMEWGAHSLTSSFIPLILYFVSRFVEERKIYLGVFISIALTLQIFSGYPQLIIYTFISVFLYLLFVCKDKINITLISQLALYFGLGIAGSLIQLIPSFELLSNSQRISENLSYDLIYLPWQNWITFFAPDFFGNHATGNFWGMGNYTNVVGYSGIIATILSFYAISDLKNNKLIRFFLSILLISLLLSFPFPWTKYLYSLNLPGIGASSLTRILILTNLSIAYMSTIGIDILYKKKNYNFILTSLVVTLLMVALLCFAYFNYSKGNNLYLISIKNLVFPLGFASLLVFISVLIYRYKKLINILIVLIIILSTSELFRFGWKYTPFSNRNLVYPATPVTDFIVNQSGVYRTHFGEVIPMNMWSSYDLQSFSGYDAVYPLNVAKYIAATNSNNPSTTPMGRHGSLDNYSSQLFDLTNSKYITVLKRDEKGNPSPSGTVPTKYLNNKFVKVFEDKSVAVLENTNVLPRVFFVNNWEVVTNDVDAFSKLIDKKFNTKSEIIISEDFNEFDSKTTTPNYSIDNIVYKSGYLSLDIQTDSNGFLFLSDTYYPGWKAFVDDKPAKIYRADSAFRSVPVTKGKHNMLFIYDPKSFRIGKLISSLTFIGLISLLIYGYKKNR